VKSLGGTQTKKSHCDKRTPDLCLKFSTGTKNRVVGADLPCWPLTATQSGTQFSSINTVDVGWPGLITNHIGAYRMQIYQYLKSP